MSNTGWVRGTSKWEQGIATPHAPVVHPCGCTFIEDKMKSMCADHKRAFNEAIRRMEEEQKKEPEKTPTPPPPGGWKEDVGTEESVSIELS